MEKFYNLKIHINKEESNNRLDLTLSKLSNLTRSKIKNLLSTNNIKKNNELIKDASYKVKQGEYYVIDFQSQKEIKFEPENIPLSIIYEDNDIIIINKFSGIVTHPAPGNNSGTLVNALLHHAKNKLSSINDKNRPGIVHRLDKETSGLIVIAKNDESHLSLAKQFKDHTISRKYKALVWGLPNKNIVEGYIDRHRVNRKIMSLNQNKKGKYSKTYIKIIKYYGIASLIECKLETGRTHQVRVHMTSINCPLVGDKTYGKSKINQFDKDKDNFNKFLILKNFSRQALHAYHLGFIHPKTNKYVEFNNDFPEDISNLLDLIVKY